MTSVREPPPRIERPPLATQFDIETLMQLARDGSLRIATFQRGIKWENSDRIALLDSIERGYPIGTLLLWKRPAADRSGLFPGVEVPRSGVDNYWIVDGQQRLMTLWEALAVAPPVRGRCLAFDPNAGGDDSRFHFTLAADAARGEVIPLYVVLDAADLGAWLMAHKWPVERARIALELGRQIRQYRIPAYVVETEDERVVRRIFERVNNTGKPLKAPDVFNALLGTFGQRRGLRGVNEDLAEIGFGALEEKTLLNSLLALRGQRIVEADLDQMAQRDADEGLEELTRALREVMRFLVDSARIPHAALVPYQLAPVVLTRFFHLFPRPSERSRILLRRWLWRASLAQRLTGASGSLQEHVDDVKAGDEQGSVQRLLERSGAGEPPADVAILSGSFSSKNARARLEACALMARRPRNLRSGELLSPGELFAEGREALRQVVAPRRAEGTEAIRTIANRLLHPATPGIGAAQLLADCVDPAALASHAVADEAIFALRDGEAAGFLDFRRDELSRWNERFFARLAEWRADDSPALSMLRSAS